MEDEKVVETVPVEETAPVEEETAPVEETTPVEETAPVETESNDDVLTLLREVLVEIKALSSLNASDTTVQVEDVEDGSNDNNADELEKQLEDFDF